MKNSIKALLIACVTFVATAFTETGIPTTKTGWTVLGITVIGTALGYVAKNFVFPSISIFGTIDLRDLLSGLILAVSTGIANWAGAVVANVPIDWGQFWSLIISVVLSYFGIKFVSKGTDPAKLKPAR